MQGETEYFLNKVQTESSALFGDVFEAVGVALFFSFISCTPFCAFERLCHISTFFLKKVNGKNEKNKKISVPTNLFSKEIKRNSDVNRPLCQGF